MIILIDNYDSFSYNVYQLVGSIDPDIKVIRNDAYTVDEVFQMNPSHIILSPGPGRPDQAGICEDVVRRLIAMKEAGQADSDTAPKILGICLGHQAICEVCGAEITYARQLMHGKQSTAKIDTDSRLFRGMHAETAVARYHSLAASTENFPLALRVTAETEDGEIMAVEHTSLPIYGVQFHPESVLTPEGKQIMRNFLSDPA